MLTIKGNLAFAREKYVDKGRWEQTVGINSLYCYVNFGANSLNLRRSRLQYYYWYYFRVSVALSNKSKKRFMNRD